MDVDGAQRRRRYPGASVDGEKVVGIQVGCLVVPTLGHELLVSGEHVACPVFGPRVAWVGGGLGAEFVEAGERSGQVSRAKVSMRLIRPEVSTTTSWA